MEKESCESLTTANQLIMMKTNPPLTELGIAIEFEASAMEDREERRRRVTRECPTAANQMMTKTNTQLTELGIAVEFEVSSMADREGGRKKVMSV